MNESKHFGAACAVLGGRAMKRLPLVFSFIVLGACAAADEPPSTASEQASLTAGGPDLEKQFVHYVGNRAVREVLLQKDSKFFILDNETVHQGTWQFDLASSTLTMQPSGESYAVKREDCEPQGWFPVLMLGNRKYIPFGIDPEFERRYCHLANP